MANLEEISQYVHDKISSVQLMLDLSVIDLPQQKMKKLGQELFALEKLLEDFEKCIDQQKQHLKHLKEVEECFQKSLEDVVHMKNNIPTHIPKKNVSDSRNEPGRNQHEADHPEAVKKPSKNFTKAVAFITRPEFDSIPQYMKGRVTYEQLNAAVQNFNTAVTAKYKILHQTGKSLGNHSRKLQQRFKNQETKATRGQFFVVEEDIQEFTQMKVDKRFQGILNMLRHCQRLRELRGGGITRYMLL